MAMSLNRGKHLTPEVLETLLKLGTKGGYMKCDQWIPMDYSDTK